MRKAAITGGVGSGKSYISAKLEALGLPHLDSDKLVHELYESCVPLRNALRELFGDGIFGEDGGIDRKALGKIVFADQEKLEALDHLVHAYVKEKTYEWFDELEKEGYAAALFEAPQLFEAGMEDYFDAIICVGAERETRIERVCLRDSCSRERAEAIIANQLSDDEYRKRSDFYVSSDDGADVDGQCAKLYLWLMTGEGK